MEVSIIETRKKQQIFLYLLIIVVLITILILYFGYFKKGQPQEISPEEKTFFERKININVRTFETPFFKELLPIEKIESPKPEETGRENPFLPY